MIANTHLSHSDYRDIMKIMRSQIVTNIHLFCEVISEYIDNHWDSIYYHDAREPLNRYIRAPFDVYSAEDIWGYFYTIGKQYLLETYLSLKPWALYDLTVDKFTYIQFQYNNRMYNLKISI